MMIVFVSLTDAFDVLTVLVVVGLFLFSSYSQLSIVNCFLILFFKISGYFLFLTVN